MVGHLVHDTHTQSLSLSRAQTQAWGTAPAAPRAFYVQMALMELPPAVVQRALRKHPAAVPSSLHAKVLQVCVGWAGTLHSCVKAAHFVRQDFLHHECAVECPVKCVSDRLYVRVSAAPYNELADYNRLAAAVLSFGVAAL